MILVTGATGDIGGEVVRQLVAGGVRVRALARDPAKAAKLGAGVEVVKGDLLAPETLGAAFDGAEKVFLMGLGQQLPRIVEHAAPAAERAGVRHVVLLSSSTILTDPMVTIGKWHRAAEVRIEATGIPWTMLRPGNFMSNTLRWVATIKAQGAVFSPSGQGRSAPIDPRDIASVGVKALTTPGHEGKRHVLTGGALMTAAEQVEVLAAALGKPLRCVDVPEAGARAGMLKAGMNEEMADALLEVMRRVREGGEALQTTTVREVTGAEPRTFATWAAEHLAAFQ
jgi:uncharacterized protein YbjT (DUF2867 family)